MKTFLLFPAITEALPNDWSVFYLRYEGNETFGWQQKIKRLLYMSFPSPRPCICPERSILIITHALFLHK